MTGMRRLPFFAVLAPAVVGDVGHRAGAVECDGGDQVLEPVGPHLPQRVAHALAFQLEHPAGIAFLQHLEGARSSSGRRSRSTVISRPFRKFSARRRMVSVVRPRKSNFTRPGLLDVLHRVLGDQEIGFRVAIERHQFDQRPVADDDAGGVGGGVAVQAFHPQRDLHQAADGFVLGAQGLQPRLAVHRLLQRHRFGGIIRDQFGDFVDVAERHARAPGRRREPPRGPGVCRM